MNKGIQLFLTFLLFFGISASVAHAQVEITFPSISGSPGQTVTVPLSIANVEATNGFSSFSFDVVSSSASVVFMGAVDTGTIIPGNWTFASREVVNGDANNRVAGFGSSSNKVSTSGTLVFLQFQIVAIEEGVTVQLTDFTMQLSADAVAFTPAVPSTGLNASNSPVAADDSYTVNEGATLTVDVASGVLANDSDADGDPLSSTVGTAPTNGTLTLNADGSFEYVHSGSETTSDSFTYTVSDGSTTDVGSVSITVTPQNDAPVFTAELSDQTVDEGALVSGSYAATDAEGDAITFSLLSGPTGAAINPSTGDFAYLATAGSAGTYTVEVQASDGTAASTSSFVLTVRSVKQYMTTLSGIHQTSVVATPASGSVTAVFVENTNELTVTGSFTGLSSILASAQIMMGSSSEAGTGVLNLAASLAGGGTSGTFEAAGNTFDLDTVVLPTGITAPMVVAALEAGNLFVNLRSFDNLDGELRGQLLGSLNQAPTTVSIMGPSSVTITGEPADEAYALTWTPGSDGDGDATKLVLESSSEILFSSFIAASDVSVTTGSGVSVSVSEAASLFDQISGASPGSIPVGGTEVVYYWLKHTDGAAISTSTPIAVSLTRGTVTDTEDNTLPSEFVLRGNYPNPFNPSTTISFDLPETADVQVDVLDLLGRTMISVPVQSISAGANRSIGIDASDLTSGIYMYRVLARGASSTWVKSGTMTLIK